MEKCFVITHGTRILKVLGSGGNLNEGGVAEYDVFGLSLTSQSLWVGS